jgi:phosphatidylinositol alpha 1,6-mannosyltransferase
LKGESLARAYANMDVFVFPSGTDTYGNVVLEALVSGVPAIVTVSGGPQYIVMHNETGFVARSIGQFVTYISELVEKPERLRTIREAAATYALDASWATIFEGIYSEFERALRDGVATRMRKAKIRSQPSTAVPPIG